MDGLRCATLKLTDWCFHVGLILSLILQWVSDSVGSYVKDSKQTPQEIGVRMMLGSR